jgi:phospholipase C
MLENHSFDNMLVLSKIPGIDAATSANSNFYLFNGQTQIVPFHGNAPESMPTDPGHEFTDVLVQLAGTKAVYKPKGQYPAIDNSGFAANYAVTKTEGPPPKTTEEIADIMAGFDTAQQLPALYQLAANFAVCDHWFSSLPGPTWPNRFFLHGASSNGLDHSPSNFEIAEWETVDGIPLSEAFDFRPDEPARDHLAFVS